MFLVLIEAIVSFFNVTIKYEDNPLLFMFFRGLILSFLIFVLGSLYFFIYSDSSENYSFYFQFFNGFLLGFGISLFLYFIDLISKYFDSN